MPNAPFPSTLIPLLLAACCHAQTPVLTVHADTPGHRIPPTLYGAFFEEINHAGDGGLYAELVRNRGFEEPAASDKPNTAPGWEVWRAPGAPDSATCTMLLETDSPLSPAAPHSLRVTFDAPARADSPEQAPGVVGVANRGYWGIHAEKGASYRLQLDARASEVVSISAELRAPDGRLLCSAAVGKPGSAWTRMSATLVPTAACGEAMLCIAFAGKGPVSLDTVSLFPADTWKKQRFGLRKDLAIAFEALKPNFVRFPGGCYVEGGDFLKDAFRWPRTVGDISKRPGHFNATWKYWSSDGLGFDEYLRLCEDLHADALFVVNCGLSHKEITPMDKLDEWVNEALDGIEYAIGPVDSPMGRLRAENGHPAPYPLKYVEIGNENGMWTGFGGTRAVYTERYKIFNNAIKERFPQIITIANTRVEAPMDVVDDHYYNSPEWFWQNVGMYDKTDRKGPRVYVGEYAVTTGCGKGNLAAALAEAAFMTGLERNSDLVTMCSYAPMFVHEKDRAWNPDMIVFDNARYCTTPSFHVQALFSAYRPDILLPVDVPDVREAPSVVQGGIGLGTWLTQAEYKDIVVEAGGKAVYRSDLAKSADEWKPAGGEWKLVDGAYRQAGEGENRVALADIPGLRRESDYTVSLKARKLGGHEGFLILFRAPDTSAHCWLNLGGWGNTEHAIERTGPAGKSGIGPHVKGTIETGRWYDVRIELSGGRITCSLDGKVVIDATEEPQPVLAAVAGRSEKTGEIIVKVVNRGQAPARLRIDLPGAGPLAIKGIQSVLSSGSLADENSLELPDRVAPVVTPLTGVSESFLHLFPARSLSVLRIRGQR